MDPARMWRGLAATVRSSAERRQLAELRGFARRQPTGDTHLVLSRLFVFALQKEHVLLLSRYHLDTWKDVYGETATGRRLYAARRKDIEDSLRLLARVIKPLKKAVYDT